MNIGIDLDGVVYNSIQYSEALAELYDIKYLNGKGIVNNDSNILAERYGWDLEFVKEYKKKFFPLIFKNVNLMPLAKEVIDMLKKEGHKVLIITSRCLDGVNYKKITMHKLKKNKIKYDKIFFSQKSKLNICIQNSIDIMIDDSPYVLEELAKNNIVCLYFRSSNTENLKNKNIFDVYNWGEIYREILNFNKEKKKNEINR